MWAQMWAKKKVMRIAHIFFVKVVGAFSEKNLSGNQKVRGGINKEKGKIRCICNLHV